MNDAINDLFGEVNNLRGEMASLKDAVSQTQQGGNGLFNNQKGLSQRLTTVENAITLLSSHVETIAAVIRRGPDITLPQPQPMREPTQKREPTGKGEPMSESKPTSPGEPNRAGDPRMPNPDPAPIRQAKPVLRK
jgi:hypothetical protein